jgi:selenocysteine lyase/cysteine desulfurase
MITKQFNTKTNFIHLNHARLSPWPQCTRETVIRFTQGMHNATSVQDKKWYEIEQQLRMQLARLLHAPSADHIALLKNTSEALSIIATGLVWQAGDNIVLPLQEFPSNRVVWQALEKQEVQCIFVDLNQHDDPEQALIDACNAHTRLLTVSAVQYSNGLRLDLARLGAFCQIQQPLLFCVDAAQQLGAYPLDVQAMQIDFLVSCGHKWLCGPEGMGILYVNESWLTRLQIQHYGWHMLESSDFEQQTWKIATTAQRFECGSSNILNSQILHSSLHLFETIGFQVITKALTEHIDYLYAELQAAGFNITTPALSKQRAGIISFHVPEKESRILCEYFNQQGLVCSQRGENIRLSPHFYLNEEQLKNIVPRIKQILVAN